MTPEMKKRIHDIFKKNKGYAKTRDLTTEGIKSNYLYELERLDIVTKIKRGYYRWNDYEPDENEELIQVTKIAPNGVICLLSALSYYELTTYNPWEYYVAIHRDSHKPASDGYPPINFFYFSGKQFSLGVTTIDSKGNEIKIYDIEKTLCDAIKYRNKIGVDVVNESIREYMTRSGRNINKMLKYANEMKMKEKVMRYLEVMM